MSEQLQSPQMAKVLSLDEQINQILSDTTLPDFVKAKMYSEAVSQYFQARENEPEIKKAKQESQPPPPPPIQPPAEESSELLEQEPGPSKQEIEHQERIDKVWEIFLTKQDQTSIGVKEDTGQLTVGGSPIVDSNIDSILAFITRKKHPASMSAPRGTAYFLEALGKIDIPLNLIPSSKLKNQMRQYTDAFKRQQEQKGLGSRRKRRHKQRRHTIEKWSKLFY